MSVVKITVFVHHISFYVCEIYMGITHCVIAYQIYAQKPLSGCFRPRCGAHKGAKICSSVDMLTLLRPSASFQITVNSAAGISKAFVRALRICGSRVASPSMFKRVMIRLHFLKKCHCFKRRDYIVFDTGVKICMRLLYQILHGSSSHWWYRSESWLVRLCTM